MTSRKRRSSRRTKENCSRVFSPPWASRWPNWRWKRPAPTWKRCGQGLLVWWSWCPAVTWWVMVWWLLGGKIWCSDLDGSSRLLSSVPIWCHAEPFLFRSSLDTDTAYDQATVYAQSNLPESPSPADLNDRLGRWAYFNGFNLFFSLSK